MLNLNFYKNGRSFSQRLDPLCLEYSGISFLKNMNQSKYFFKRQGVGEKFQVDYLNCKAILDEWKFKEENIKSIPDNWIFVSQQTIMNEEFMKYKLKVENKVRYLSQSLVYKIKNEKEFVTYEKIPKNEISFFYHNLSQTSNGDYRYWDTQFSKHIYMKKEDYNKLAERIENSKFKSR